MFLSETHLPQLLPASAYASPDWFERERESVLLPAWHVVTTLSEIPKPGDFVTATLLGHPLIVHNADGDPRCFINACAHRFSRLTGARRGNQCRLTCGYHGWEYDADGSTRRIPDAPSFKPLEKGRFGLVRLDTATCGGLVFVRLRPANLSLEEFLGPYRDSIAAACGTENRQLCSWSRVVESNWKLVVENTLESYHVSEIHRRTLGAMPGEQACRHELHERSSSFTAPGGVPGMAGAIQRRVLASLGKLPTRSYEHILIMPTLTLSVMDDLVIVWTFEPLDERRTQLTLRGFGVQAAHPAPVRNRLLAQWARKHLAFWGRVWEEDVALYPLIHEGVSAPLLPGPGLLSRREERVHHFQQWLCGQVRAGSDDVVPAPVCRSSAAAERFNPKEQLS
jgi:phenylpropionate dioxygenase-like ring-hydroxylating dioxygenase large terminal subunit